MFKRVFLFIATNILVIGTISILVSALGLHSYLTSRGIDYTKLALFCGIWGMGGAFISLFMSKFIAKTAMGVVIINPNNATREEHYLLEIIYSLANKAGLKTMPEVGIYHSPELNAFATGPTRNNALVAVSSGLLSSMNRDEVEAVLGHEISHIANGDMVTMTLIQGVVNAFALFLSRIIAYVISITMARGDDKEGDISYMAYSVLTLVFDILFTLLGSILVAAFSRWREYRADAGGSKLAGRNKMIAALMRLQTASGIEDDRAPVLAALKISRQSGWLDIFSTHPPLEKRIARLQEAR
ncbi:Protease HtpX [Aquicella siphonis]|uniref:Protease HtpX n=1 Tax=Aquicella siphonis TaxID=254247 RepID=A0A5E4PJM7_9COXI|nr:protease HtpX [Aquicella siphonis]VVC77289.1 Protease HtpX [Aquicella siphonis]